MSKQSYANQSGESNIFVLCCDEIKIQQNEEKESQILKTCPGKDQQTCRLMCIDPNYLKI